MTISDILGLSKKRFWGQGARALAALLLLASFPRLAAAGAPRTIVVLGDSISAEFGLVHDTGWVKLLAARLQEERTDYSVVNASISGDTLAGGRARLPALLASDAPAIVIVELGGNDGLRGLPISAARENLAAIITMAQTAHAQVLLVGMQLPPNYGPQYAGAFSAMYADLAHQYHTALVPSFLGDVGARLDLFQQDDIHPGPALQPYMRDRVLEKLRPLLR